MRRLLVAAFAAFALSACGRCTGPIGHDDAGTRSKHDAGVVAGEGEGEGTGDAGVVDAGPHDAGPPDPNVVGLDARPSNTTCKAPARPQLQSSLDVVQPWPNLQVTSPLLMLQEPGTTTMYVIERGGTVVRFDKSDATVTIPELFGDITDRVNTTDSGNDERGLLGMAFHPDWPAVQDVFLSYSAAAGPTGLQDRLSRFTLGVDGTIDESSEQVLISIDDPASNHNGGMIAFSPTDACRSCLYLGIGDGGNADGSFGTSQNKQTLLAKILRIDVDGTDPVKPYGIPADNPFVNDASFLPEIYAWGLRNPWRWSFDRGTGDLWAGDVGQNIVEEIDRIQAGGNYGWNVFEGDQCHTIDNTTDPTCSLGGYTAPITTYVHGGGRVAVMGGYVYRGTALPALVGTYLYADFGSGEVFALQFDNAGNASPAVVLDLPTNIASFSEDASGELYVLDHVTGRIQQIVPAGPQQPDTFPQTLSATGCVDASDATKAAAGLIPYTVNHALWSDGAVKERFAALPDGTKATILSDGDIDFPIGTVFMKTFRVAGQLVETRLLVHHDDGDWGGYSYEWNAQGTDANLVDPGGKTKTLANGQQWTYPTRNGCLACHTLAAHRQLGWELAQLNGGFVYPTGRFANQLHTLDVIGVFDSPLPDAPANLPAFPGVDDTQAPVENVARAYLHVNCSICHRPGGIGVADTDWRFQTDFASMALCGVTPTEGDLGVTGSLRMAPGDPSHSLISLRMKRLDANRMPLLGSVVVDTQGTTVIDNWITSVTACPP
jgi:uncharacterized repeat protein (TIGR03806 family)